MACLPRDYAEALKKALNLEDVSVDRLKNVDAEKGKALTSKLNELADLGTAERRAELYRIFSEAPTKVPRSKAEIEEIITSFNKGFEQRILSSSRDIKGKIADLEEIVANTKNSDGVIARARAELDDLKGGQDRLLAKQRKALLNWVEKRSADMPKKARKQTIDKIRDIEYLLDSDELPLFLEDMVATKAGFGITNETKSMILKLSQESTKALESLNATYDKYLPKLKEFYLKQSKSPDLVKLREQIKAGGVKGRTVDDLMTALDAHSLQYADEVMLGERALEDGIPLTKNDQLKIYSERNKQGIKTQVLIEMIGYQERLLEWAEVSGVRASLKAGRKYEAFKIAGNKAMKLAYEALAMPKSLTASFDWSTLMRQLLPVLLTDPKAYKKSLGQVADGSFKDLISSRKTQATKKILERGDNLTKEAYHEELGKMFLGSGMKPEEYRQFGEFFDTINIQKMLVRADIATHPNALRGYYDIPSEGFGLHVNKEEALPSSYPGMLPVIGRPFRASETFFEVSSLKNRQELANKFIYRMQADGIDWTEKKIADEMSLLVTAFTGRGHPLGLKFLNSSEGLNKFLNVALFSPRFVGSRIYLYSELGKAIFRADNPATRMAAKQIATFIATDAALLTALGSASYMFWGEEGGLDLTLGSPNFGYVRAGNYTFDFTGGYGSYLTMLAKMNQVRTGYKYDPKIKEYVPTSFAESATGVFSDFLAGKMGPGARVLVDYVNGYGFGNSELYTTEWFGDFLTPIIFASWREAASKDGEADALLILFAEFVGVSSKDIRIRPMTKEFKELEKTNPEGYEKAIEVLNVELPKEIARLRKDDAFYELSEEEQRKEINRVSNRLKSKTVDAFME